MEEIKKGNEVNLSPLTKQVVYDLPFDVWLGYTSYARIHANNSVAKVMEEAFELLMEREKELHDAIPTKLIELEERVAKLESSPPEDKKVVKLLGGYTA
jgi:hypothetical protein